MLQKPKSCEGCPLFIDGRGFSNTEGRCSNGVLIIGEALGSSEVMDALPFRPYAEAGSALHTAFRILNYDRSNFGLWNMLACQPPYNALENTSYEYPAIEHCRQAHFDKVIKKFKPKVILALGNVPLKHLWKKDPRIIDHIANLPEETKEDKAAKKKYLRNFLIGSMRGYILPSIYDIPLIPSFHPSFITREKGRIHLGVLMQDLTQAINIAQYGIPKFTSRYIEEPTIEQAKQFYEECKSHPDLVISHDIETPYTALEIDESEIEFENQEVRDIDSVQFSIAEGTGIFMPFFGDYINIIRDILNLPNAKIGWNNWKFDEINLEYHLGVGSINGNIHDVMWMWKWMNQDFIKTGRALQFATNFAAPEFPVWKHLAQIEAKNYGCLDVDATLRVYEYLIKVFTTVGKLKNGRLLPDTKSLLEGYEDDVVQLRPILKDITKRGFPIDVVEREKFRQQILLEQDKNLTELQQEYPTQLRRLKPLEGYKTIPSEVIEIEELFKEAENIHNDGPFYILDSRDTYNFRLAQYIESHTRQENTTGLILKEFDVEGFKLKRYCRMEEFKPGSSQQVIKYLEFKGYKVPTIRDRKKGERQTTAKDHLQPLWEETGDDLLYKCIYQRELDHMLNTYVGDGEKEGWKLGSDNRVHAEFLFKPSTGQLSSSPNIQNAPARGTKFSSKGYEKLAKQFRKTIAAKPGHTLVSSDWNAFHINTLAFESEDPKYMRIGRLDPHSYLTANILQGDLPSSIKKLIIKKPDHLSHDEWVKEISKGEEAIDRLKSLDNWLDLNDIKLKEELNWFKKNYKLARDSQSKPALLGMGFGMKVNRFFKENRHTFKNKAEPERILKLIKKLFPKTFIDYHEYIKNMADKQTYLMTRYGYIRRFFDVYDWRPLKTPRAARVGELIVKSSKGWWIRKDGESANEAIAYNPSNDAFGKKKESMRDFWNHPNGNLVKAYGLINEIHDDLMWEIEDSLVNEALPIIKNVMESPARFLKNSLCPEGLVTKVEIKVGRNWAEMEEVKL